MFSKNVLAAIFCLTSLVAEAKIVETRHIEDVIPLIDDETWLLVDLDNCMFEGAQALGHANWFYDELQLRMQKGMSREEAIADAYPCWIETQKACKVKPLENSFVPTLLMLQSKGITIMGLTHRQPSVADSTVRQVHSLGFDFLTTAPSKESFVVLAKTPTLYFQGILFVGDYNKKIDIYEPFLSMIKKTLPKKIVFIDDKRKNVDELESLAKYGIDYVGVHYTAIEHSKPVYVREIAEFQYKLLNQIISNKAATLLMESGLECLRLNVELS
ncbi:MAG: DUF2608 domain-containing protein [Parachlamydiaceae bacterium]|nr:DUF2608 domain-containing protein [Parachlamydiaceae bacterium]